MFASILLALLLAGHKGSDKPKKLPPAVQLEVSSSKTLDAPSFGIFGIAQSDEKGDLFFHAATTHYTDGVILGVSAAKAQPTVFKMPEEFTKANWFETFGVSGDGRVYLVTQAKDQISRLFVFDADGKLDSHVELELGKGVSVPSIAVFASGNIFVNGYYGKNAAPDKKGKVFLTLVSPSGKILRNFASTETFDIKTSNQSIGSPSNYVADDGNLYVLGPEALRVYQESGKLLRTFPVTKPSKEYSSSKIVVSKGIAALWFVSTPNPDGGTVDLKLETVDANTGRITGVFYPSEPLGNQALTFTREDGFVFIDSESGKMRLLTASID
jgi:hypothetical protein